MHALHMMYTYFKEYWRIEETGTKSTMKYGNDVWRTPNTRMERHMMDGKSHLVLRRQGYRRKQRATILFESRREFQMVPQ